MRLVQTWPKFILIHSRWLRSVCRTRGTTTYPALLQAIPLQGLRLHLIKHPLNQRHTLKDRVAEKQRPKSPDSRSVQAVILQSGREEQALQEGQEQSRLRPPTAGLSLQLEK